ncbi:MAG: DUF4956 domain-containing protein [Ruminococcaceae bacterium]|nr:DUF4956 domain-containing protein [Oscillospiraceae bacterium]
MTDKIFSSILESTLTTKSFLICAATSVILGFLLSITHLYKNRSTKSFSLTVALLPLIVQVIIMLVNGNLGTGIAVAGAFSLVRFRSVPGNAREILSIFMAMSVGLATGVGHIGVAIIFTIILILMNLLYCQLNFGETKKNNRELKIVIPESLNYTDAFEDIFDEYTHNCKLKLVKTTNMGSLYKLVYLVTLKDKNNEKEFIDKLRTRNGNLEISCNYSPTINEEL